MSTVRTGVDLGTDTLTPSWFPVSLTRSRTQNPKTPCVPMRDSYPGRNGYLWSLDPGSDGPPSPPPSSPV